MLVETRVFFMVHKPLIIDQNKRLFCSDKASKQIHGRMWKSLCWILMLSGEAGFLCQQPYWVCSALRQTLSKPDLWRDTLEQWNRRGNKFNELILRQQEYIRNSSPWRFNASCRLLRSRSRTPRSQKNYISWGQWSALRIRWITGTQRITKDSGKALLLHRGREWERAHQGVVRGPAKIEGHEIRRKDGEGTLRAECQSLEFSLVSWQWQ